ncbi:MAG: hypothetical protein OXC08_18790, partial [Thiotrichales bacterium]|nr:hypothetical protein [Thiotrichales bacterium]
HDGRPVREVDVKLVEATGGAPPPEEKPPPRMTSAERNALLADCRRLVARREPGQTWERRRTPADEKGYDVAWASILADHMKIPVTARALRPVSPESGS